MASPLLKGNLQPTDFADSECRVSPWVWVSWEAASGYRVWSCRCSGFWFQRHEWARPGRNSTEVEPWIFSGYHPHRRFEAHLIPAPPEDDL